MKKTETIIAPATPKGEGALALIRISGPDSFENVEKCIKEKKKYKKTPFNYIKKYSFLDPENKNIIDDITLIKYKEPNSFTGENSVEIISHGGYVTVERILESLLKSGCKFAKNGEFTKRAFENGKIDLVQAESVNQIIKAKNPIHQEKALKNYYGEYKNQLDRWKLKIENILCDVESIIEFGYEDDIVNNNITEKIKKDILEIKKNIIDEKKKYEKSLKVKNTVNICFAGLPNAGKSSLLNLILDDNRSIVHHEPGTTRDVISETFSFSKGQTIRIIDTAGIRMKSTGIESIGIEKTYETIEKSDIVIWVSPSDDININEERELNKIKNKNIIAIINKIDIISGEKKQKFFNGKKIKNISISAIDKKYRNKVINFIKDIIEINFPVQYEYSIISNIRQSQILDDIYIETQKIGKIGYNSEEFLAEYLRNILNKLDDFVGKTHNQEIINQIFNKFCIGK